MFTWSLFSFYYESGPYVYHQEGGRKKIVLLYEYKVLNISQYIDDYFFMMIRNKRYITIGRKLDWEL